MSETKSGLGGMLIFCITFLGLFIALVEIIPGEFYTVSREYEQFDYPDYFTQEDIQHIKYYLNQSIPRGTSGVWFDFNPKGSNFKFIVYWGSMTNVIQIVHVTWEFWVFWAGHTMTFTDQGFDLTKEYALAQWDSALNVSVIYPVQCDDITVKVWIGDSNTTRNDLDQAWEEGEVTLAIGYGFEDYTTKLSAWDIIGRLLTFQSPEIFGLTGSAALVLNLLIALPVWATIAYLLYRLILMAIPFVGG